MRLPLWLDVDWEYSGDYGEIHLHSVKVFDNEIMPYLSRYEIDKIKAECLEKQKEIWAEQRA